MPGTTVSSQKMVSSLAAAPPWHDRRIYAPYEDDPAGQLLTSSESGEYFQTVGHADLFQDGRGEWSGMALATRNGPGFKPW